MYKQKDNSFYYIHIPRTGGRYVRELFKNSKDIESFYDSFEVARRHRAEVHLHYPLYEVELPVVEIPHITIVRNPLERFESAMKVRFLRYDVDLNEMIKDKNMFEKFMAYQLEVDCFYCNWFLPQYKYISEKTKIWKYEWGFGPDFFEWVKKHTGFEVSNPPENVETYTFNGDRNQKVNLSKNLQRWAKEFYKRDYEKFKYKL